MELKILRLLRGYVRIRITGDSCGRFLNLCAFHKIILWDLCPDGESCEANLSKEDFRKLRTIIRKSHVRIRITGRYGLPFFVHRNRKRKVYLAGIAAAALFMVWLSSHIWLITIDGNVSQTDDVLFEYLNGIGITHGMLKKNVDCRALAADIRNYFTDFTWVAAKLEGTQLVISVKEGILKEGTEEAQTGPKSETGEEEKKESGESGMQSEPEEGEPADLAASEAGTVASIYVRRGLPQVEAGAQVEAGDILVSGALPVYDDSGSVRTYQYVSPDADIVIRSTMEYHERIPFAVRRKVYTGETKKGILLRVADIPFGIGSIDSSFEKFDFEREIRQAKLFENFYLPLYAELLTVREYVYRDEIMTKEQAKALAAENFRQFLINLRQKGVQLFENDVKIEWYENFCAVSGTLDVGKEAVRRVTLHRELQEELHTDEHG